MSIRPDEITSVLKKEIGADQKRIPREGRETLVGRVTVTCGTQREHLPDRLARIPKKTGESMR